MRSCGFDEEVPDLRHLLAMFDTIGQCSKCQNLDLAASFGPRRAICHDPRQGRHLSQPATIILAFELNHQHAHNPNQDRKSIPQSICCGKLLVTKPLSAYRQAKTRSQSMVDCMDTFPKGSSTRSPPAPATRAVPRATLTRCAMARAGRLQHLPQKRLHFLARLEPAEALDLPFEPDAGMFEHAGAHRLAEQFEIVG